MSDVATGSLLIRKSFSRLHNTMPLPNLIEVQSRSFNNFIQLDFLPSERKNMGLEKVFRDIFPVAYSDSMILEYLGYELGIWKCICGALTGIANRYTWHCESCQKGGVSRLDSSGVCNYCSKKSASYIHCAQCLSRVVVEPSLSVEDCRRKSQTFSLPLRVKVQLTSWEEGEDGVKIVRDMKEQEIFFLDLPIMVDLYEKNGVFESGSIGTFVVNGVERVVVSQMHRSPGVVFAHAKKGKDQSGVSSGYTARIIPMRGSWIDIEIDQKEIMYVRIDKAKKVLVTTFLQALGIKKSDIAPLFHRFYHYTVVKRKVYLEVDERLLHVTLEARMFQEEFQKKYANKKCSKETIKELKKDKIDRLLLQKEDVIGKTLGEDVYDKKSGEVIGRHGEMISDALYEQFIHMDSLSFVVIARSPSVQTSLITLALSLDKCNSQEEALKEVYSKIFSGVSVSYEEMKERINNLFFNPKFYDFTKVGRVKVNRKLGVNVSLDILHLTREDIVETIRYLINLKENDEGSVDDIDHLGNRRIRLVGELLSNQVYSGMLRVERIIKERFRMHDTNKAIAPYDLINVKPLGGIVREFFATGQLSQLVDQTNPLSELAHKRRLSALGPGGITRDRATYEVRDVHASHYGKICPIETPEGQTIGLIASLATLASVNDLGFIETPYRPVKEGKVENEFVYIDAFQEEQAYIAQIETIDATGNILKTAKNVLVRHQGNFVYVAPDVINYVDSSPNQIFSVATSLIPFLQHDDGVRALMGSNMQRQAVPLVKAENAIIGTGLEREIAIASGACIAAKYAGIVRYVSSKKIIIESEKSCFVDIDDWVSNGLQTYHLRTFDRSVHDTLIHQIPSVTVGQKVAQGELITHAAGVQNSELAIGTNLLVAFMPWYGYNFEDAIVINQEVVSGDRFTSIQIEEYVIEARDTRLGPEEITKDIPHVHANALESIDDYGIVKIGTQVKSGDILVGKITLKGDAQYSPEEKLLRAIFGEKSKEVRDTSLRVPAGVEGVVVGVDIFSRGGPLRDESCKAYVATEIARIKQDGIMHKKCLYRMVYNELATLLGKEALEEELKAIEKTAAAKKGKEKKEESFDQILALKIKDVKKKKEFDKIKQSYELRLKVLDGLYQEKIASFRRGDKLAHGVIKMIKVYVASIRYIQVGDKIAGRHGNKGVVSIVLPREDMPFMEDGTPIDVVINPLGVPSRMNIGQILEIILGYCGKKVGKEFESQINTMNVQKARELLSSYYSKEIIDDLVEKHGESFLMDMVHFIAKKGLHFSANVFDSGNYNENIKPLLEKLHLSSGGTYRLRDGGTGEYFDQKVTVGTMYMIKLNHMIDDKLHARSVGPYSLVTQQPLGGKAQMGGQRFGEMEVWALEAYGAAYTLQELITYKSDDVIGRNKTHDAIVRGERVAEPGTPESFNVLVKELQALGLRVDLVNVDKGGQQ